MTENMRQEAQPDRLSIEELRAALGDLGLRAELDSGLHDLIVTLDGQASPLSVLSTANATPERVSTLLGRPSKNVATVVLVADRITAAARALLTASGWSWFDRRGHLYLRAPGIMVDRDVPATHKADGASAKGPIVGRAGREVAYALLMGGLQPDGPLPVRASAPRLGLSPASVSTALARLTKAGLVESDGRPVVPELFWALTEVWRPTRTWLREVPLVDEARVKAADLSVPGWCLTGTAAAVAWGAPLVVAGGLDIDLYVPEKVEVTLAARRYGTVADPLQAAASIAVPPISQITRLRCAPRGNSQWPLVHPVAIALELAEDRGRGREILSQWTPPEGFDRVW